MSEKKITYTPPKGTVCATKLDITLDHDTITSYSVTGGCSGNGQAVAALVRGMQVEDAIARLRGISCKGRGTSCADQLAQALEQNKDLICDNIDK